MSEELVVARETPQRDPDARERDVRAVLAGRGYPSLASAARAVDLDYTTLTKVVRFGLALNPRVKTIEGLRRLGILELVTRES